MKKFCGAVEKAALRDYDITAPCGKLLGRVKDSAQHLLTLYKAWPVRFDQPTDRQTDSPTDRPTDRRTD